MRRYLTIFILVASIATIGWIYFSLSESQPQYGDPWKLLPGEISFVAELEFSVPMHSILPWLKEAAGNRQMIGDVPFNPIAVLPGFIPVLDSLHSNDEYWHATLENKSVLFATTNQMRGDQWILIIPGQKGLDIAHANAVAQRILGTQSWNKRSFNGVEIHEANGAGYLILENCIVVSTLASILESVVIQSESDKSPFSHNNFQLVLSSAASDCAIHLYYNIGENEWLGLDPDTRNGKRRLTGFGFLNDTSKHRWSTLTTNSTSKIASLLPPNVTTLEGFVHPDFRSGWAQLEDFQSATEQQKFWSQAWKDLGDSCACDLNEAMLGWRGGEWGSCEMEDSDSSTTEIVFISALDSSAFRTKMNGLFSDSILYNGFSIYQLRYPQLFDRNKSALFQVDCNYAMAIGTYVFFASSAEELHSIADAQSMNTFLSGNPEFKKVSPSNFEGGHYIYHSTYLATELPQALIKTFGTSDPLFASVSKFNQNQLMVSITWPGGIVNEQAAGTASESGEITWPFESSQEITRGPWAFKNHNTGDSEILVQDASGTIYLLGNDGRELWKLPVEGPILNKPVQVDALKNGKLQLVFATASKLYGVDRKGGMLPGFPVLLPSKAVGELSVFDYDQTRNYRLLIGTSDGRLNNYSVEGKKTEGWIYEVTDEKVLFTEHLRIGSEDFIATTSEKGNIRFLKRNGEVWRNPKLTISDYNGSQPLFLPGVTIENTRVIVSDKNSLIYEYDVRSGKSKPFNGNIESGSFHFFGDVNGDHKEDIIIAKDSRLWILDSNGDEIYSGTFPGRVQSAPIILKISSMDNRVGIPADNNRMLIMNLKGEVVDEIVSGIGNATSGDFNHDTFLDFVSTEGTRLLVKFRKPS